MAQPVEPRPRKRRRAVRVIAVVAIALALIAGAAAVSVALATRQFAGSGQIAEGVTIAKVPVGGQTEQEAAETVRAQWVSSLPTEITLKAADIEWKAAPEKLGVKLDLEQAAANAERVGREGNAIEQLVTRWRLRHATVDVSVTCTVDQTALRAALAEMAQQVNRKASNASVRVTGADDVTIEPEKVGVTLDVEASTQALATKLTDPTLRDAPVVVKADQPSVTARDLAYLEKVLGTYTTHFDPGQTNRTHNLTLAAQAIDGTVLLPGQEFSLNTTVGQRLSERGYRTAPIFREGEVVQDIGGGVCQVATTVYNAALFANLDVLERHNHGRVVTYIPTGRDASVYWGSADFRLRNSLGHTVLMLARVGGGDLTVTFIGSKADDTDVELVRSGVSIIPHGVKEIKDPKLEEGKRVVDKKGHNGATATLTMRVKQPDGTWVSTVLHHDVYPAGTEVVKVGAEPKEGEPLPGQPPGPGKPPQPAQPALPDWWTNPPTEEPAPGEAPSDTQR